MVDKKENSTKDVCNENEKDVDDNKECETAANTSDAEENIVEKLEQQVAALKDTLLRKVAESENLRKRLEKEKNDAEKYANGKFAKDLLSVIDNLDRVNANFASVEEKIKEDQTLKTFFDGIQLCGKELLSVFKKHGITPVEVSEGTAFDPHYHQAMCEVESADHEPGSVIHVMQAGYVYHDRLLRPAMVSVAKKTETKND